MSSNAGPSIRIWVQISLYRITNSKDSPLGIAQEASIAATVTGAVYYGQLVYTMEKDCLVVRTLKVHEHMRYVRDFKF